MIQIDIDADLNMVDDDDRNLARPPADVSGLRVGGVAAAGRPGFWSWVVIEEITEASVAFRQVTAHEAALSGDLVIAAPA
ncbi:MAG: hypothetical protein LBJ02_00995 [Bifidobacteriaceae bacterium]|jgi:hypothetical protein|nr:hypothetical protein [Bifidobacteriaceae bacterium]